MPDLTTDRFRRTIAWFDRESRPEAMRRRVAFEAYCHLVAHNEPVPDAVKKEMGWT